MGFERSKLTVGLASALVVFGASVCIAENVYDVTGLYENVSAPEGSIALTSTGEIEKIQKILIPKDAEVGTYDVNVTRCAEDLYEIDGRDLFVRTRFCRKHGTSMSAVLRITASSGQTLGELVFLD
jgi:hypothetical protein